MQRILIVGATSLIAEHCARLWNQQPGDFVLVGRDADKLERIALDLRARNPASRAETRTVDFTDPAAIEALVERCVQAGPIDLALIAHGLLPDQAACQTDLKAVDTAIAINATSPVLFAEALVRQMTARAHGTLGIIGSVAGDRGRRSNYVYGAAKALVDRYAQGLQHRLAGTPVRVVRIKPGPTRTPMTAELGMPAKRLADPALVARDIVRSMAAGKVVVYTPWPWRWIMLIIRHIPAFVFARINL